MPWIARLSSGFDPPPDSLAVPWSFLGGLALATVGGAVVASALAARAIARLPLAAILREE